MLLYVLLLGIFIDKILIELYPDKDPVKVFNGIILSNTLIIIPAWIMEAFLTRNSYIKKEIIYDNMDDVFDGEEFFIGSVGPGTFPIYNFFVYLGDDQFFRNFFGNLLILIVSC